MNNLTICVYGAGSSSIDQHYILETEQLGAEIGHRGYTIIYGGGSTGLMGACARGALSVNGEVIGVIPRFMYNYKLLNDRCSETIWTESMGERKEIMESRADAFIVLPGGVGTMDEFFQILTLSVLKQKSAPIILYNIDGYYDDLISFIDTCIHKGFIQVGVKDLLRVCSSPGEALDLIEYFA